MLNALTGFAVIALAIAVGYLVARFGVLGAEAPAVLGRLVYFVLAPALLFVVLSESDVQVLFSALLPVSALTAILVVSAQFVLSRYLWRRALGDAVISGLAAGQVNSNNIGIPLSIYLLGSAAYPAPVILFQLVILTPIAMALLEIAASGTASARLIARRTATNPIIISSALGALASVTEFALPVIAAEPLRFLAAACVPVLLIGYGMSLRGSRVLAPSGYRRDIVLAVLLKLVAMPLVAWVLAQYVFSLPASDVLIIVVLASLPTAQNVFNYAQRFGIGLVLARDVVFLTTLGCIPLLLVVMAVLG